MKAHEILQEAMNALNDRAASRDVEEERSMRAAVASFNALYGLSLTEEQGWMFQVILKASRSKGGDVRVDDYIDGSSYFALAGECAIKSRN